MTPADNAGQIELWNGDLGDAWARYADLVDVMFADLSAALLEAGGIGAGDRVLDLGCGSGGLTLALAERVGPIGAVTAVDVSGPMLDRGRDRGRDAGLVNVTWILADAADYPFAPLSFDAVVSQLGAMFFDDPVAALRNVAGGLDPLGRLALATWRAPRENPWAMAPVSAAREFLDMPPRPGPEDPGPFSLADPERIRCILGDAGFADIDVAPLDLDLLLGRSFEEALGFSLEMGPLAAPFASVRGENRRNAIAAVTRVLEENRGGDGLVRLGAALWIVTARAA